MEYLKFDEFKNFSLTTLVQYPCSGVCKLFPVSCLGGTSCQTVTGTWQGTPFSCAYGDKHLPTHAFILHHHTHIWKSSYLSRWKQQQTLSRNKLALQTFTEVSLLHKEQPHTCMHALAIMCTQSIFSRQLHHVLGRLAIAFKCEKFLIHGSHTIYPLSYTYATLHKHMRYFTNQGQSKGARERERK